MQLNNSEIIDNKSEQKEVLIATWLQESISTSLLLIFYI